MNEENEHLYDDIIDLPHHVSEVRPQTPLEERAVQFSAFEALKGFEDGVDEAARFTGSIRFLDEERIDRLSRTLNWLIDNQALHPEVTLTCFVADKKKKGGEYEELTAELRWFDEFNNRLVFIDGREVLIEDIWDISSESFEYGQE